MVDEPSVEARFGMDHCIRTWRSIQALDAAAEARFQISILKPRLSSKDYEARRRRRHSKTLAKIPMWPQWARPLTDYLYGRCTACHGPTRSPYGVCGDCQKRAGREAPRLRLAVYLHVKGLP